VQIYLDEAGFSGNYRRPQYRPRAFPARPSRTFRLLPDIHSVHTPTMTLKNAALLALIGTVLMMALLVWNFVVNFLSLLRGLVPAVTLFSSLIYAFGAFSVMMFFFVFHRTQS
jgi:hypothetical protein